MSRSSLTCVDANLVVRLVTGSSGPEVRRRWREWQEDAAPLVAPLLMRYEVTNALHRLHLAGEISDEEAQRAIEGAISLPIRLSSNDQDHAGALAFAARFSLPAAYDSHYLALADRLGADFWTSDRKLANAVRPALPWVHLAEG